MLLSGNAEVSVHWQKRWASFVSANLLVWQRLNFVEGHYMSAWLSVLRGSVNGTQKSSTPPFPHK